MKKLNQRLFVIIIGMILALTGCNVNNKADNGVENSIATNNMNVAEEESVWSAEYLELSKDYSHIIIEEDGIYGSYSEEGQAYIERLSKESGEVEKKLPVSEVPYIKYFQMDDEGYFNIIGQDDKGEIFVRISSTGSVEEITKYVLEDLEGVRYYNSWGCLPKKICTDSNGYTYIWYEMYILASEVGMYYEEEEVLTEIVRVYVKDEQMNTISYVQILDDVWDFRLDETGVPYVIAYNYTNGRVVYRQDLDIEKGALGTQTPLDWASELRAYSGPFQEEDGFCFPQASGDGVWKYDYSERECEKLFNLYDYGLDNTGIVCMQTQEDRLEIIYRDNVTQKLEYTAVTKGKSDKQVITVGTTWVSDDLSRAVADFNRQNDELQVQVVSYWDGESSYEDSIEKLKLDIVSGKAPDIIEVSDAYMSILVQKGVFADLYTFMEADEECQKDMLVEDVLELYEKGGHLYNISPAFYLYSMWGSSSVVQERYGISLKDLEDILAENGQDMNAVYGFYSGTSVLETLCTFGMDELVDWEQGTCDFEGAYFQDLLTFAKEYEEAKVAGGKSEDSMLTRVRNGKILFSGGMLCNVADYQVQREIFGGDLDIIGYPTANGSGTAASYWGSQLAINAAGEHQKEAWEFVKSYIVNGYSGEGFPLVKELFESQLQQAMEQEYVLAEDGVTKVEVAKGGYSTVDEDVLVYAASQEDVDAVRWMVGNASQRMQRYMEIQDIIDEEAQAYLQGQKSLSETAAIIQNRISLYLQEQK